MLFNGTVHTSNKFGNLLLNLCPRTVHTRHMFSNKLRHIFVQPIRKWNS